MSPSNPPLSSGNSMEEEMGNHKSHGDRTRPSRHRHELAQTVVACTGPAAKPDEGPALRGTEHKPPALT